MRNELGSIFGHDCCIKQGPTVPRKKIFGLSFFYYAEVLLDVHLAYMHSQVGLSNNVGLLRPSDERPIRAHE